MRGRLVQTKNHRAAALLDSCNSAIETKSRAVLLHMLETDREDI